MKLTLLTLSVLLAFGGGGVHAASFDCRKASAPDEVAVCDSRELSELDVKMATLYETITKLVGMGVRGDLQDQQRGFLRARGECGQSRGCIRKLYESRIHALEAEVARVARGGPY